jgi:hypothetical protein
MNNYTTQLRPKRHWQPDLDSHAYPILLPHITCLGQDLYAGNRKMDRLTPAQAGFLADCTGAHTFAQLLQGPSVNLSDILHLTRYLLWWPDPVSDSVNVFDSCDRLVLCTEPEIPILAMGGRLLEEARVTSTTLLTCFNTPDAAADLLLYRGLPEYRLARLDESYLLARLTGLAHIEWNSSYENKIDEEVFRKKLHAAISKMEPAGIFIPAALGNNEAARLIRNSILTLYAEGYIQSEIHLYADEPPAIGHRAIDEFLSWFENSYLNPVGYLVRVSGETAVRKYALPDLFRCGNAAAQKKLWRTPSERFWKLNFTNLI